MADAETFKLSQFLQPLLEDLGQKTFQSKKTETSTSKAENVALKVVARENDSSLLMHSHPATFTLFNRMRHLVLQEQLVERYNSRSGAFESDDKEDKSQDDSDALEMLEIPKIVSLGLSGLFELVKETWKTHPELCKKALQSFFNMLQGIEPEHLREEPTEVIDALNQLLTDMVNETLSEDNRLDMDIASLAASCLTSLVLARGEPHRILSAIDGVLTGPEQLTEETLLIPENMILLQRVVQATLLNATPTVDWFEDGIKAASQIDVWPIKGTEGDPDASPSSVANDGRYLYILCVAGLLKLGTGYGGTIKGHVYVIREGAYTNEKNGWLGYANGKLYYSTGMVGEDTITVLNTDTLEQETSLSLDSESLGPNAIMAFDDKLAQILARKDGSFEYREYNPSTSPLECIKEKQLNFQQRRIFTHGKSDLFDSKDGKQGLKIPSAASGESDAVKLQEKVDMCGKGSHKFTPSLIEYPCRICANCGHCTGYGPTCIATKGVGERIPGSICGCGSGCSGCLTCGVCLVCAEEAIPADHTLEEYYIKKTSNEDEKKKAYEEGRERIRKLRAAAGKKKPKGRQGATVEEKTVDLDESSSQIEQFILKEKYAVVRARDGKVRYTGSKIPFGMPGNTKEGEWLNVELPDEKTVTTMACTATTIFYLNQDGQVFTSGLNHKGEMGEKGSSSNVPFALKEHSKLKDQKVTFLAAHSHKLAAVNSDGSLFMFGKVDKKVVDPETGVVTTLLGTNVVQVALGLSHVVAMTDQGTIMTFGQNRYGQCGRNYVPVPEKGNTSEEGDDEGSDDEPEAEPQPSVMDKCNGKHKYEKKECRVCNVCGYCTGYGPGCCNTHAEKRDPGTGCGCGEGESGCVECGVCQVCTGDPMPDKHSLMTYITSSDVDVVDIYEKGRERVKKLKEEKKKDQKEMPEKKRFRKRKLLEPQESVSSEGMGLKNLFESENDSYPPSRQQSMEADAHIPAELRTDQPGEVTLPNNMPALQIACGQLHTVILTVDGSVWGFGNNQKGQLGQGRSNICGEPVKIPLTEAASQVVCGDFHTVVLLATGEVVTFGDYEDGQLGRVDEDSDDWHLRPGYALKASQVSEKKATYISADGNRTVLIVSDSLLTERSIGHVETFCNENVVGAISVSENGEIIMINTDSGRVQRLRDQADLFNCAVCLDSEHNVLWSFCPKRGEVACFNPVAAGLSNVSGTILSPSLTVPVRKGSVITRSDAALNLLSCLRTLCSGEPLDTTLVSSGGPSKAPPVPLKNLKELHRFKRLAGTWGHDGKAVDAVRFSPNKGIVLGGLGVYGCRSPGTYEVTLYDAGENSTTDPGKSTVIATAKSVDVKTTKGDIHQMHFTSPPALKANHWYTLTMVKSSGDSDSGSSGTTTITGPDAVVFTFKKSKLSNNGTDIVSGQIPVLSYLVGGEKDIAKNTSASVKEKVDKQELDDSLIQISKRFSREVTQGGVISLLHLLEWAWKTLLQKGSVSIFEAASSLETLSKLKDSGMIAFVALSCLDLLSDYITIVYPPDSKASKGPGDTPEVAQCVYLLCQLIKDILSDKTALQLAKKPGDNLVKKVMDLAKATYISCFHAFYPTAALKWLELCRLLEFLEPNDVVSGGSIPQLLCCVLELLTKPSVGYIGLGYSSTVTLKSASLGSEQDGAFPILCETINSRTMEQFGSEVSLLSFQSIADRLMRLVSAPIQFTLANKTVAESAKQVIDLGGQLLVSRIQELALWNTFPEALEMSLGSKSSKIEEATRFSETTEVTKIEQNTLLFSVNHPIVLRGFTFYRGGVDSRESKMTLKLENSTIYTKKYKVNFSGKKTVSKFNFRSPLCLEAETVYTLEFEMDGGKYSIGTGGSSTLKCQNGIEFTFHKNDKGVNPERGPIASLLFSLPDNSLNPLEMYLTVVNSVLNLTKSYLERAVESSGKEIMETLNNSFLCSTLLPMCLAQLGPIAARDTKFTIEALSMLQGLLPLVTTVNKKFPSLDLTAELSQGVHVANIETEHPYLPASVLHYQVKFSKNVKWMTVDMDPRGGFAQKWDRLEDFLVPKPELASESKDSKSENVPYIALKKGDFHYRLGAGDLAQVDKYPKGVLIVPGNEIHFEVITDTEYDKKDNTNHFGLKCQIMGFEWSSKFSKSLTILEKELVTLSGMCCGKLLQNPDLPWFEILNVTEKESDQEKADMRIVEAASKKSINDHSAMLSRGLMVNVPSIAEAMEGTFPSEGSNPELEFLYSFIEDKEGTPASRLARWLQPERSVDMNSIQINLPEGEQFAGKSVAINVIIKDQTGTMVAVPDMQVELLSTFKKGTDKDEENLINPYTGVCPPQFKYPFTAIMQGNLTLQSISAMMPYCDYSFEELRLFAPLDEGSGNVIGVCVNEDGSYLANWVPQRPGTYQLQLKLDGKEAGITKELTVNPIPLEESSLPKDSSEEDTEVEKTQLEVITLKRKKSPSDSKYSGLRIRAAPSLKADMIGLIKPGDDVIYYEELKNEDGCWIKIPGDTLRKFKISGATLHNEGFALVYKADKEDEKLLVETDPIEKVRHVGGAMNAVSWRRKRKGGPGIYVVLHCGTAGHNIRAQPTMKSNAIGRLKLGDTFKVKEEVETEDGIWLKFTEESVKKFCKNEKEAWALALAPSGKLFLHMDNKKIALSETKATMEISGKDQSISAAERLFGKSSQKDVIPPPPPLPQASKAPFQFSLVPNLDFTGGSEKKVPFFSGITEGDKPESFAAKEPKDDKKEDAKKDADKKEDAKKDADKKEDAKKDADKKEDAKKDADKKEDVEEKEEKKIGFSLGVGDPQPSKGTKGKKKGMIRSPAATQKKFPLALSTPVSPSISSTLSVPRVKPKAKALSPAVAECQRAVFAAFLWHEGLVHDAQVSATYLKFHPELVKELGRDPEEKTEGDKDKPSLPPTLNYLVTLWEELATKVTDATTNPLRPTRKDNDIIQNLQAQYDAYKKQEEEKVSALKKTSSAAPSGGGKTVCELCGESFTDPVTYHMKQSHPGCRKHANGWGYNSRGGYCSGWAGNCGDGGSGSSTWYLLCKSCHEKYLTEKKAPSTESVSQAVTFAQQKIEPPGKSRELASVPTVQSMLNHAKFLLEISSQSEAFRPKALAMKGDESSLSRQISSPESKASPITIEAPEPSRIAQENRPSFIRSVSMIPKGMQEPFEGQKHIKKQTTLGEPSPSGDHGLLDRPSHALNQLIYTRSVNDPKGVAASYERIMKFVTANIDLEGLKCTMKQLMRIASVKIHALKLLCNLLEAIKDPVTVHIILWHCIVALVEDPIDQMIIDIEEEKKEKDDKVVKGDEGHIVLCKHPLMGLEGAGMALSRLRDEFHAYLRKISYLIPELPMGSASQLIAMRSWCIKFQPQDQPFLVQCHIFNNVSSVLANMDDPGTAETQKKSSEEDEKDCEVLMLKDILSKDNLKVSSNQGMLNSLTDGSTETFWESSGESRTNFKKMDVTFDDVSSPAAVAVHFDNTKDTQQRIDLIACSVGGEFSDLKKVIETKMPLTHCGWKVLHLPTDTKCKVVRVEAKGPSQNIRVRQLKVLSLSSSPNHDAVMSIEAADRQACEQQALQLFRLLTSQVFGGLLADDSVATDEGEAKKPERQESVVDGPTTPEPQPGLHGNMVDILFGKSKLTSLQKLTGEHLIRSIHSETVRMEKEYWETIEEFVSPRKDEKEAETKFSSDTYCYELMSMVIGLSGSEAGCSYLSEKESLIKDLFILLHVASMRVQLQVVTLLRRLYPVIEPEKLARILDVPGLPPVEYSAIAEATSSKSYTPTVGILDNLLACISKALSLQARAKGMLSGMLSGLTKGVGTAVSIQSLSLAKGVSKDIQFEAKVFPKRRWLSAGSMPQEVAMEVIKLINDMKEGKFGSRWKDIAKSAIGQAVLHLTKTEETARIPQPGLFSQSLWLCLGALCVINQEHATILSSGELLGSSGQPGKPTEKPTCDNHDDGKTLALVHCEQCGNLCGECDRILHLPKKAKVHQRKVFKEEEEAVKVDLHENSGRVKLYWIVALADSKTLKGMVEFRETSTGAGGQCRFCGTSSGTSLLTVGTVCSSEECQERSKMVCDKTLPCGHGCCGVKDEEDCLPCLHGCSPPEGTVDKGKWGKLKQDVDDMCMICYTENLSCAPSIQLDCGHVFHFHCCGNALSVKWSGPRITFRFMFCSLCENVPIAHPRLKDVLDPVLALFEEVKKKALLRLEYENMTKCDAIVSETSKFYQKPAEYAMHRYAYYVCFKCNKAYYGGEAVCAEAASDEYDPKELVCGGCSDVTAAQVCPKHGTDFLEYKCRYCCSVAVFFCFGTTHFCTPCHDDFSRLTNMPVSDLPQCPVGPRAKPLEGNECPLHVNHPATGEEFALGCGVCRNAQTF